MKEKCKCNSKWYAEGFFFVMCYGTAYMRYPYTPDTVQYLEWVKGYQDAVLKCSGEVL